MFNLNEIGETIRKHCKAYIIEFSIHCIFHHGLSYNKRIKNDVFLIHTTIIITIIIDQCNNISFYMTMFTFLTRAQFYCLLITIYF